MNRLRKIYCRTYQTVFRLALPFLPYRTPEVVGSVKKRKKAGGPRIFVLINRREGPIMDSVSKETFQRFIPKKE